MAKVLNYCEMNRNFFEEAFQEQMKTTTLTNNEESKDGNTTQNKTMIAQNKPKGQEGKGGKFVRIEGAKFDIILNILIGIRRSLSTLVRLPGQELTDWQFKKKMSSESDWID